MSDYQVDGQKWKALSIFEQMGNIYSEIGRTFAAKQRKDPVTARAAAARAFDLFDATSESLAECRSPKLQEVLRARELFADEFITGTEWGLDRYFSQFAIAARLRQFA
jgi:hypothetical protein